MINNATLQLMIRMRMLRDAVVDHERDRGATAVEYGLLITLIAVAIITGVTLLGTNLDSLFSNTAAKVGTGPVGTN
jgi:pilus assembly protein Flp/PilA